MSYLRVKPCWFGLQPRTSASPISISRCIIFFSFGIGLGNNFGVLWLVWGSFFPDGGRAGGKLAQFLKLSDLAS